MRSLWIGKRGKGQQESGRQKKTGEEGRRSWIVQEEDPKE